MTHVQGLVVRRLLSHHIDTSLTTTNISLGRHIPCISTAYPRRAYHRSLPTQDKASSPARSPSPRPQQNKKRESLVWQRHDRKEPRKRISTLALDPSTIIESELASTRQDSHQGQSSRSEEQGQQRKPADKIFSRNQRRIMLLSTVLLLPVIGRDIMEVVVPGILGTIIFVGGKVKTGIKWVRRIGSME